MTGTAGTSPPKPAHTSVHSLHHSFMYRSGDVYRAAALLRARHRPESQALGQACAGGWRGLWTLTSRAWGAACIAACRGPDPSGLAGPLGRAGRPWPCRSGDLPVPAAMVGGGTLSPRDGVFARPPASLAVFRCCAQTTICLQGWWRRERGWGPPRGAPFRYSYPTLSPKVWPPHQLHGGLHHPQPSEQDLLGQQVALGQDRTP